MLSFDYGYFSATHRGRVYRLGLTLSTALRLETRALSGMTPNSSRSSDKSIILVGLMGAGKTSVGRKLAEIMDLSFTDADEEICTAAGCPIEDIFEKYGEDAFRDVEERVISRLLKEGPRILAAGGGAFMNPRIRALIAANGISVWLRAELDVLVKRTRRRGGRPLLKNKDHRATLEELIIERGPVYAEADIVVDSTDEGPYATAQLVRDALAERHPSGQEAES